MPGEDIGHTGSLSGHNSGSHNTDGGNRTWTRRLSDSGKINFPHAIRARNFFIIEPGALSSVPLDQVHFYYEDDPIHIDDVVQGEIRRGKMKRGQITIPADYRRKGDFPMGRCDVTVIEKSDRIIVTDPEPVD